MFHLELLVTNSMWGHDSTISSRRCDGLGRIHQHLQSFPLYLSCQFWGGVLFLWFQPSKDYITIRVVKVVVSSARREVNIGAWVIWNTSVDVDINHLLWCCFLHKAAAKKTAILGVLKVGLKKIRRFGEDWLLNPFFFSLFGQCGYLFVKKGVIGGDDLAILLPNSPGRWSGFARTWQSSGNGEVIGSRAMGVCWGFG